MGFFRRSAEAVLFLEKHAPGKGTVRLNYLVGNCGWSPVYTVRAGENRKKVGVECNALIHQLSGEDWNGVTLTLSTASPARDRNVYFTYSNNGGLNWSRRCG